MKQLDLLRAARARIEQGWCQIDPAVDIEGRMTGASFTRAVKWCAVGALLADGRGRDVDDAIRYLEGRLKRSLSGWNDDEGRTKADVLKLYNDAIWDLENEE